MMPRLIRSVAGGLLLGSMALVGTAQLSGTYTIDPLGSGPRNYKTFAAATTALKAGVSGPVAFSVASATFKEEVMIEPISGASATNTISFVAPRGPATIDATGGSWGVGVNLGQKVEWVRLTNLRVIGWSGVGVGLAGWAQNNIITRVVVDDTVKYNRYAVMIDHAHKNIFRYCTFRGGNTFVVYLQGQNNLIDSCELDGIGKSTIVVKSEGGTHTIQNCFLHSPRDYFCFEDQGNSLVLNNVFLCNTSNAAVAYRDPNLRSWNAAPTFKNNILINLGSGPAVLFDFLDASALMNARASDRNCFHAPNSTGAIQVDGTSGSWPRKVYFRGSLASFLAWQKTNPKYVPAGGAAGYDLNSSESDPGLVSIKTPYDVHLKSTSPLIDKGTTQIVELYQTQIPPHRVTHDLDSEVRGWKPDIGADEIAASLSGSGGTSPGSTHALALAAPRDGGRGYQVGSSFGTGPVGIGWRQLGLGADDLLVLSVGNYWPQVFAGYRGTLDKSGNGQASIRLPRITALVGHVIHSAFVTLDPQAKFGLGSISTTHSLTVTK